MEDKKEWYEIDQVCSTCGAHFIADYIYNSTCYGCRFKLENESSDSKHTKKEK